MALPKKLTLQPLQAQPAVQPGRRWTGKVMRRLVRSIAKGEEITQVVSTLENPQILTQLSAPL